MKEYKRVKDPIYGYIRMPVQYMTNIVDTAVFQRLRRIIQTSYAPLYSSAVHNRFVHSMGVFYLGELAANQLIKEVREKTNLSADLDNFGELFKLACLLHDVGHAPFSHTGEDFYLEEDHDYTQLHHKLIEVIGNEDFSADIPENSSLAAAAHEIMSAIIGISEFEQFFDETGKKEFFARCITGYQYSDETPENNIKNCFISMLNSKVIDVDKLDYLIRDAYITGFDTVNIDFERLLSSLTISENGAKYRTAYYKNAISVIENVVYAHDAERKWIQTHPVVLYEIYILQHIMGYLSEKMDDGESKLFSLESLSKKGQRFRNGLSVSLLCDDDIIYLMKNTFRNELCEEFFERRIRRHPVWKSEAELDSETRKVQLADKKMILKVVHSLEKYADEKEIDCNFIILMASQFNSGFGKPDFSKTNIVFQTKEGEKNAEVGEIVSSLEAKERERDNFFYLFYKRKDGIGSNEDDIDNQDICERLFKEVAF